MRYSEWSERNPVPISIAEFLERGGKGQVTNKSRKPRFLKKQRRRLKKIKTKNSYILVYNFFIFNKYTSEMYILADLK